MRKEDKCILMKYKKSLIVIREKNDKKRKENLINTYNITNTSLHNIM